MFKSTDVIDIFHKLGNVHLGNHITIVLKKIDSLNVGILFNWKW